MEELQQSIRRQDPQTSSNGGEQPTRLITDAESQSTLEFYGKSYDDLRAESVNSLKQLWSCLNLLSSRVGKIGDSIEQLQSLPASVTNLSSFSFLKNKVLKFLLKWLLIRISLAALLCSPYLL